MVRTWRDDGREAGKGMSGCRCIARERLESAFSWDTDRDGRTEEVGIG